MISLDEIIGFIVPSFLLSNNFLNFSDDILQTFFFTTICALFIVTLLTVLINAKEKNWNKKWYKQDRNKKFNVEYITVDEVSEAAETKSEKLANAMPSILLTVGLLGTFIGLGIALDKASSILANTNTVDNAENQMIQLMAMLDGLGAKFKTSTWGLSAFILLKFILSFIGYESKRLEWSANKVKEELDSVEKNKKEESSLRDSGFSNQLNLLTTKVTRALLDSQSENKKQLMDISGFAQELIANIKSENLQQSDRFKQSLTAANNKYELLVGFFTDNFKTLIDASNSGFSSVKISLENVVENSNAQQEKNINLINDLISKIEAENSLRAERFYEYKASNEESFSCLVSTINDGVSEMTQTASAHQQDSQSLQKEIILQNKDVRDAMVNFIEKNDKVVDALSLSATKMSGAAKDMGQSASQLEVVISNLRTDMEGVIGLLKNDLSTSITDMNTSFSGNMVDMTSGLQSTIMDMNKSFKFNISEMSGNLKGATEDISDAVKSLSFSVEQTMTEVTQTINQSMDLQAKAQKESSSLQVRAQSVFAESTENLNSYVVEMTGLVEKLSGDIVSGLNAVSTSNRNVIGLTNKVESLFDILGNFNNLNRTLEGLIATLKLEMNVDFTPVLARKAQHHNELLSKIENLIKSTTDARNSISEELIEALKNRENNKLESAVHEA